MGSSIRKGAAAVLACAFALCAMLLLGVKPAYADEVAGDGWTLDDNGVFTLTADIADLENPSAGKYPWAQYADQIVEVRAAEGVTRIPGSAFSSSQADYSNLQRFVSSSTMKSIGNSAFAGDGSLKEIELNDGLEEIGLTAFSRTGLTEVDIPANVNMLSDVFTYCASLKRATVGGGATWGGPIGASGNAQFYGCTSLETVILEEGTTSIPNQFLNGCSNLKYVWIPRSVTYIDHAELGTDPSTWGSPILDGCIIGYSGTIAQKYVERWDGDHGYTADYPITFHAIDGDAHEGIWQTVVTPSCTTAGQEQLVCDICGATQTREIAPTGHSWDGGVVTAKPTATTEGVLTYTCTVCGATKTEPIAALGAASEKPQVSEAANEEKGGTLAQTGDDALLLVAPVFALASLSVGALAASAKRRHG